MSDVALKFLLANLAAAIAILLVIALRKPARAAFGARLAYSLWLLVPLAALGSLLPPRIVEIARPAPAMSASYPPPSSAPDFFPAPPAFTPVDMPVIAATPSVAIDPWMIATLLWLAGGIAMLVWQMRNQSRFMADARAGFAGPAVAGVFNPRIITPADFEERFEKSEREVILAHEKIHLDNNDARINALVALLRCLCWFNPLVHIAAHLMRIDQELACDAAVVERHPRAKAVYANALLKAQLASRPLPLGCYWPAGTEHPLTERVEMLKQARPTRLRQRIGIAALALLAIGAGATAWAVLPPEQRLVEASTFQDVRKPVPSPQADAGLGGAQADAPLGGAAPAPVLDAPAPAPQQTPEAGVSDFDPADPVHLLGKVESIDFSDTTYVTFVRASGIAVCPDGPAQANTALWELAPTPYWGDRDAVTRDLLNQHVYARGFNAKDKSCSPNCRMQARGVFKVREGLQSFPYRAAFTDRALTCQPPPATRATPQPIRYEPQQPAWNAPLVPEASMPIYLRGKVEKIDFRDTSYVVFIRTTSIIGGEGPGGHAEPNQALWELSPTTYFGDRETITTDLMGKNVEVRGTNLNAACTPSCSVKVRDFIMPRTSEVPAPPAGGSHVAVFARWYDTTKPALVRGTVERIQFHDGMFDAWIRSETSGPVPGRLYQVRSEYRFPRADIERELLNKMVVASGWRARENINTHCEPVCGMYATEFEFPNKARLTPSGDVLNQAPGAAPVVMRLVSEPMPDTPAAFREVFDWNTPLTIEGKIIKVENAGVIRGPNDRNLANVVWVETTNVTPASTPGAKAGTVWRVVGGGLPNPVESFIGGKVTASGYAAKDKSCQPTCMMAHVEMSVSR